jgi:hypothetical protein
MRGQATHLRHPQLTPRTCLRPLTLCRTTAAAFWLKQRPHSPPEADDLPTNCDAPENEMTARVPHSDATGANSPTCVCDRSKVWQTLSEVCKDDKCWTCVKPFQRQRDGRGAFQALHAHCLGANHVSNVASVAEAKLAQAKHCGEKRRHNFETHVLSFTEQFQVLNTLWLCGHAGIDKSSKVRRSKAGIKRRN